ncbi:MAG: hypothetical protein V3T14_12105 [Myxococcota bacterium]
MSLEGQVLQATSVALAYRVVSAGDRGRCLRVQVADRHLDLPGGILLHHPLWLPGGDELIGHGVREPVIAAMPPRIP